MFGDRLEVFRVLVGSDNYNLADQYSDKDYKVFVLPSFNDLYSKQMFSKSYVGEVDLGVHDIRHLTDLLFKANVNFLEILYSKEIIINDKVDDKTKKIIAELFEMKESIVKMNIPYLYSACKGMYFNKEKQIDKGTENTQYLIEKYGYDTKATLTCFRILDFAKRFYVTGFNDFEKAIRYTSEEREQMLKIKHGVYSYEESRKMLEAKYQEFLGLEEFYKSVPVNEETEKILKDKCMEIIKINIV